MRTTFFAGAVLALVASPAAAQTSSVAGQPVMRAPAQAAKPSTPVKQSPANAAKPPRATTAKAPSTPEFAFGGSAGAFRRSGLR